MAMFDNKLSQALASCIATALVAGAGAVYAQSASIPASLEGTYSLTFGLAQSGSLLANGSTVDMNQVNALINKAQQLYADLLPGTAVNSAYSVLDGYVYRYYDSTGIYIGIKDNTVYVLGGEFGDGAPVTIGTIANTLALADAEGIDASTFSAFQISDVSVASDREFYRATFTSTTTT